MNDGLIRGTARAASILAALVLSCVAAAQEFYWDNLKSFGANGRFPQAYSDASSILLSWQESAAADQGGQAYLSFARGAFDSAGKVSFEINPRAIGPIAYRGSEPSLSSICLGPRGAILAATSLATDGVRVYRSDDGGKTFASAEVQISTANSVSPRVFALSGGGYILFVTQGDVDTFTLAYSLSANGLEWSEFKPFIVEADLRISFLPTVEGKNGKDIVVFQSLLKGERSTYQLYAKTTTDGGRTFSAAKRITSFADPSGAAAGEADSFDNQNPNLSKSAKAGLSLVWERSPSGQVPQIYRMGIDESGSATEAPERLTDGRFTCSAPQGFELAGTPGVAWSDNRGAGSAAEVSLRGTLGWESVSLGTLPGKPAFVRPVTASGTLFLFWQNIDVRGAGIFGLLPDRSVDPPSLAAVNFKPKTAARQDGALLSWTPAQDSSGIAGYSFSWGRDPNQIPPKEVALLSTVTTATQFADSDGPWYFSIRAVDYAGNWSSPARIEFDRDTTPPAAPVLSAPPLDASGALQSNTFALDWAAPPDEDLSGYTYSLRPMPPGGLPEPLSQAGFPLKIVTTSTSASFKNIENSEWLFELAAIDAAGNVSKAVRVPLTAARFIPFTAISYLEPAQDESGVLKLSVYGRGFTDEGRVTRVIIDLDGKEPYNRVFTLADGGFRILNNRAITGISTEGLDAGDYRIGLDHEKRGIFFSNPILPLQAGGTVKLGNYSARPPLSIWRPAQAIRGLISPWTLPLAAFAVLLFAALAALGRRLALVVEDGRTLKLEIQALFEGGLMPESSKKRDLARLRRRGAGLRLKFSLFVIALVFLIVLVVSVPLILTAVQRQRQVLGDTLSQRINVLMDSLSASERSYDQNALELGTAVSQVSMAEVDYVTITGLPSNAASTDVDAVWASSDPVLSNPDQLSTKLSTQTLVYGASVLKDPVSARIGDIRDGISTRLQGSEFQAKLAVLADSRKELDALYGLKSRSQAQQDRINELELATGTYTREIDRLLSAAATELGGSEPKFLASDLGKAGKYLFYRPVFKYNRDKADYYVGMIRIGVSSALIVKEIASSQSAFMAIGTGFAIVSFLVGVAGALILALIVINPIKRLVSGVEIIRDTPSKEKLAGLKIDVRTRDELRGLSDAINQMTLGLVRGAKDNADLLAGEQDQRELLPLESDAKRRKLSMGKFDSADIEFFGYYKGAKLVSGDYLDFRQLDSKHYAFIKCDVSGKGVSAAMIMAVVASVFRSWFDGWTPKKPGYVLDDLCYRINDTLNICEFKGKFATLMTGIIDMDSGKVHLCHAGDKFYRILERETGTLVTHEMAGTAPAGPFPSFMIKGQTPFKTEVHAINPGDVLLLYTDGIDEARRYVRDAAFKKIKRKAPAPKGPAPDRQMKENTEEAEYEYEDFGNERAAAIVEAVAAGGAFALKRNVGLGTEETFEFDFSDCRSALEEYVMALVSAEKAFRFYRPPEASEDDQVKADRRIDEFLRTHFKQYFTYCSEKSENPEEGAFVPASKKAEKKVKRRKAAEPDLMEEMSKPSGPASPSHYIMYDRLLEDEQYDDITVLAIRRK